VPKGYWIVAIDVQDPSQYAAYQKFVRPFLAENGGRFLVRGGAAEVVEGISKSRNVVIEFDSYEQALNVYRSEAYQQGMQKRLSASVTDFVIVEGLDG